MTRKRQTLITLSLLIAASIADVWVTLHFNPTLSREANPLVSKLGLGAFGFIAFNVAMVSLLGFALMVYLKGPKQAPSVPIDDPWGFAGMALYQKPMTKYEFYRTMILGWPLPSDWHQFIRFIGFVVAWCLIAGRLAAVFSWFAIWDWKWSSYIRFRGLTVLWGYPCLELILGLVVAFVMVRVFVLTEFKTEKQDHSSQHS